MKIKMTKRRIIKIAIPVFLIALFAHWSIEPLSLNPFSSVEMPIASSSVTLQYKSVVGNSELIYNKTFKQNADSILNNAVTSGNFLGLSVGVYKEGWGQWTGNAGFSSKKDKTEVNDNTLYRLASISKPMTALGIMKLFNQGRIDLDEPIQNYIPDLSMPSKEEITIRQLLMHTSGIAHYKSSLDALSFTNYETLGEAIDNFKDRDLQFIPGTQYAYSTYGYTVLGAIIEAVTGLSYQDYMKQILWEPTNMNNTGVEEQRAYENKARLYIKVKSSHIRSPYTNLSSIYPGGGIQSNTKDMLKFSEALLNYKIVDSLTLNAMIDTSKSLAPAIGDTPNGLGWNVYESPDYGRVLLHGGSQPGAGCFYMIYLDQKIAVSVLSNSYGSRKHAYAVANGVISSLL